MRILFVCLGNICRSPTAEGVMRRLLREEAIEDQVTVDSAGTGSWHVGSPPDPRAAEAARRRGLLLEGAARQIAPGDFEDWDLILAMDRDNHRALLSLAPDGDARRRVRLLREFDAEALATGDLEVPDPYYGGDDGFERVLDVVERACRGLLAHVRERV